MPIQPFLSDQFQDNSANPTTSISVVMDPVPTGKLLRVEHISGRFAVGTGDVVDRIRAMDGFGQDVYLPVHFASRELNFGGALGVARDHQFGSPVRMYIETSRTVTVRGDANVAGVLTVSLIGQLLDL